MNINNTIPSSKEVYGWIYVITNQLDNKKYIGQTTIGFDKRYTKNLSNTSNIHLKRAIKKYGLNNFVFEKEFKIAYSKEELDGLEKYYISFFGGINSGKIYNLTEGGSSGKLSEEVKRNISKAKMGFKALEETKKRLSEAQQLRYSLLSDEEKKTIYGKSMRGKTTSEETKKKISKAQLGHEVSKETREKISNSLKGTKRTPESIAKQAKNRSKKVICLNDNFVYNSIKEASTITKADASEITKCCKGKVFSAGKDNQGNKLRWTYYVQEEGN